MPFSSTTSSSHVLCCAHGDAFNSKSEIGGIQKSLLTDDLLSVKSAPRCCPRCRQPDDEVRCPVCLGLIPLNRAGRSRQKPRISNSVRSRRVRFPDIPSVPIAPILLSLSKAGALTAVRLVLA